MKKKWMWIIDVVYWGIIIYNMFSQFMSGLNVNEINTIINDIQKTATAFFTDLCEIERLNITISFLFLTVESAVRSKTITVTVLIPPAVPTGEPPINISTREIIADVFVRFCCGSVANPAVLVVTD